MISMIPPECYSHPVGLIFPALFIAICICAALRSKTHSGHMKQMLAAPFSGVGHVNSSSYAVLVGPASFSICALCAALGAHSSNNETGLVCGGMDLWDEIIPAWWANVGPMAMLYGIYCSTCGIPLRQIAVRGGAIQVLFALANMLLLGLDGTHTMAYFLRCHGVQHLAFAFGVQIGDALLNGQRCNVDQAMMLRNQLLHQRVEQLTEEKERANFDRLMMQQTLTSYTVNVKHSKAESAGWSQSNSDFLTYSIASKKDEDERQHRLAQGHSQLWRSFPTMVCRRFRQAQRGPPQVGRS